MRSSWREWRSRATSYTEQLPKLLTAPVKRRNPRDCHCTYEVGCAEGFRRDPAGPRLEPFNQSGFRNEPTRKGVNMAELPGIAQLFNLSGRCAVVTGGGAGIGQAAAQRLAEAGARVVVTDVNMELAAQTVDLIVKAGGRASALRADAQSVADAGAVFQSMARMGAPADILVNNAGIFPMIPLFDIDEPAWDRVLNLNLKSVFFYSQAAAQEMIKAGKGGRIINLASIDALHPNKQLAHYGASKGGVVALTRTLALELAPHKILVNAVAPGNIMTYGVKALRAARLGSAANTNANVIKGFAERMPLGRPGEPDEVARAILFLASPAADYITGSVVTVDGGFLLS